MNKDKIKVLIIGRGGRESAITKKVLNSNLVTKVYIAPGNYQTGKLCENVNIEETDIKSLVQFASDTEIDLTIVGPESSLEAGIVDEFEKNNLAIFGPSKVASLIESSKSFAKTLMDKYNIPTASYEEFTDVKSAVDYAKGIVYPHVIKYDGLAAGKGVVICASYEEMEEQIKFMLEDNVFGDTGKIILEEFLDGEEFTLLSLVKDEKVYPLEVSRDFKRAYDNDAGLNTGGMGAICPFDKIDSKAKEEAINILNMTAKAMMDEGKNFKGVLYGGFINTPTGVKVIEYNARFGDPECEVVLQKLSSDLIGIILNILNNNEVIIENDDKYYVGITMAAKGYPLDYNKGFELNDKEIAGLFHMGTKEENGKLVSAGGRVLFISAFGNSLEEAKERAYKEVRLYENDNLFYRKDIGKN